MRRLALLLPALLLIAPIPRAAHVEPHEGAVHRQLNPGAATLGDLPLTFVHLGDSYRTIAGSSGLDFGEDGVRLALADPAGTAQRWGVRLAFPGARSVQPVAADRQAGVVSFFRGSPDEWRTGLRTYARLRYEELWPGIDLHYTGAAGSLKYEFRVAPGADPDAIGLDWRGAAVTATDSGGLRIATPAGSLFDGAPIAWQSGPDGRTGVQASWARRPDGGWGFHLGGYDPSRPLVIDPEVLLTRFIGGSGQETGQGIAVDGAGNIYVSGSVYEPSGTSNFPATVGPDTSFNGSSDLFVAKLTPAGAVVYAGFIGGTSSEQVGGIAADASGAAYVTGTTSSSTAQGFPATVGPDTTFNGNSDTFVAKVKPDGTGLVYAGYIGGTDGEYQRGDVDVDGSGAAYVAGETYSDQAEGFPVLGGPDITFNGSTDAFVAKVKPNGSALDYAGYIGGSDYDGATAVALDPSGAAYVGGYTGSTQATFPDAVGPDTSFNGAYDGFVAKVKPNGSALDYAGYVGGTQSESVRGVDVDGSGAAYVGGDTVSDQVVEGFPVTVGPDTTFAGPAGVPYGPREGFVGKVQASGSGFGYLGYVGGNDDDAVEGVAVDATGGLYVAGRTGSTETEDGFPASGGPDTTFNGGTDGFVGRVLPSGAAFGFLGYLGGLKLDFARGVAVDAANLAYVTGETNSNRGTFAVLGGPQGTEFDAFVVKVGDACRGKVATIAGTGGKDTLTGTNGADVIAASGGRDTVNGKGGKDLICGGEGNDKLKGGGGKDRLYGEEGKDVLIGQAGNDICVGGPLKDRAKDCEKERQI